MAKPGRKPNKPGENSKGLKLSTVIELHDSLNRFNNVTPIREAVKPDDPTFEIKPHEKIEKETAKEEEGLDADALSELKYLRKKLWFERVEYIPHEGQEAIHRCNARNIVAVCGRRFGKSLLTSKEAEVEVMKGNKRIWVVAPTYSLADKVFREIWQTFITGRIIRNDLGEIVKLLPPAMTPAHIEKKSLHEMLIRFNNGSIVEGKSCDNPESLLGERVDLLIFDECAQAKKEVWEKYLMPTLADSVNSRAIFITTPEGQNWVYDVYQKALLDDRGVWAGFHFPSDTRDSPALRKSIEQMKRDMDSLTFDQQVRALFTVFKGKMFPEWDMTTHVIDNDKIPKYFDEYLYGYDDGFANPACGLAIGVCGEYFYVLDEFYRTGMSESDKIEAMLDLQDKYPGRGYADSAAPQTIKAFRDAGVKIYNAKKEVKPGLSTLGSIIKIQEDGYPRLFVSSKCKNLINELNNYRHRDDKEEPVKQQDHACDALRYALHTYIKGFRPRSIRGNNIL